MMYQKLKKEKIYQYDEKGRLSSTTETNKSFSDQDHDFFDVPQEIIYAYDNEDRLIGERHSNCMIVEYEYNEKGNLVSEKTFFEEDGEKI